MHTLKFFFNQLLERDDREEDDDPLRHPALAAMSQRELADLPLMPENLGRRGDVRERTSGKPA